MKRIFLNKRQAKLLEESIYEENIDSRLPEDLFTNIMSKISNFPKEIISLYKKGISFGFDNSINNFSDDIENVDVNKVVTKFSKLINICIKKEERIRPQLEKLCYNTIVSIFEIPNDEFELECKLSDVIDPNMQFHISSDTNEDYEYNDVSEIESEDNEVSKRKLINTLIIGAALDTYEKSKKVFLSDLFDLDEELPHLYSKVLKLNEYLLYKTNIDITDKNHSQGGFVKVTLGTDNTIAKIESSAVIFPILLCETIKGVLELVASNGLPDSIDTIKNVINKSDVLENEPLNMMSGKYFWHLFKGDTVSTDIIPEYIYTISKGKTENLMNLLNELNYRTKSGNDTLEMLLSSTLKRKNYEKLQNKILQRQNNIDIIEDDII